MWSSQDSCGHISGPWLKKKAASAGVGKQSGHRLLGYFANADWGNSGSWPLEEPFSDPIECHSLRGLYAETVVCSCYCMASVVATSWNPHVKALYERLLARGKTKKSALGAAMHKLVHLCFGVLKTRTPYQPNYAKNT